MLRTSGPDTFLVAVEQVWHVSAGMLTGFPLGNFLMVTRSKTIAFPQRGLRARDHINILPLTYSPWLASTDCRFLIPLRADSPSLFFWFLSFSFFLSFSVLLCFLSLFDFFYFIFFFLLFVLSTSPFFSCVNFQVPLIIIVPHPGAPHLPLLPLPMTATSYHGNHMKLQGDSLGLHIVPVWSPPSIPGKGEETFSVPPNSPVPFSSPRRHRTKRSPHQTETSHPRPPPARPLPPRREEPAAKWLLLQEPSAAPHKVPLASRTWGWLGSNAAGNHCLTGCPSSGSGKGRGKRGRMPLMKHCSPKIRSSVVDSSTHIICDAHPVSQDRGNSLTRAEMAVQRPGPSGNEEKDQVTICTPRGVLCAPHPHPPAWLPP